MGYRMIYQTGTKKMANLRKTVVFQGLFGLILAGGCLIAAARPEGRGWLERIFLPGQGRVEAATRALAGLLASGEPIYHAAAVFCGALMDGTA